MTKKFETEATISSFPNDVDYTKFDTYPAHVDFELTPEEQLARVATQSNVAVGK